MRRLLPLACFAWLGAALVGAEGAALSASKSLVWGTALDAGLSTGALRYLHIAAVDVHGNNMTAIPNGTAVSVRVSPGAHTETFDHGDGTLLVRFSVPRSIPQLTIHVTANGKHMARSPYTLTNVVGEDCECPMDIDEWISRAGCQQDPDPQIADDFALFPKLTEDMVRQCRGDALVHYVVKDNVVFAKECGDIVGFRMFSDAMLLSLTRKVRLPDVEFVMNLGDYPKARSPSSAIVSWCGSTDTFDFVLPQYKTYSLLFSHAHEDFLKADGVCESVARWDEKLDALVWRGRDANQDRLRFVRQHRERQHIDANITAYFFFRDQEQDLGKAPHMPIFDFFKYKYLLNIDGTVAAYRLATLLAGNSLVLKQASKYYEHFYHRLKPYQHFVPLERDLSDIDKALDWARNNDEEAARISRNARLLIREHLQPHELFCYQMQFFKTWSARQTFTPTVAPGMKRLASDAGEKMRVPKSAPCACRSQQPHSTEL